MQIKSTLAPNSHRPRRVGPSGITSHRQPRQYRRPKTVKGAQSDPNYVSRLLDCVPVFHKIITPALGPVARVCRGPKNYSYATGRVRSGGVNRAIFRFSRRSARQNRDVVVTAVKVPSLRRRCSPHHSSTADLRVYIQRAGHGYLYRGPAGAV